MSRIALSALLVTTLISSASHAEVVWGPHFSAPPPTGTEPAHTEPNPGMPHPDPDMGLMRRRALSPAAVREALVDARKRNLAAFLAYDKTGVFPHNTYQAHELNVWRDADGHYCAAATIIRASGAVELVDKVADQNNFIKLADVEQGPLMDWILTSGLTQEELVLIQRPFRPVGDRGDDRIGGPPRRVVTIDEQKRKAEDRRLHVKYRAVVKQLAAQQKKSVDLAVERLMKHPTLAWQLIDS